MDDKKVEDYYVRPPKLSRWQTIKLFLWNPKSHEFLGRTAQSWFQITLFYVILYAFLAGFFASLLIVFYQTLDASQPRWQLDGSRIGNNPGMGYRPSHPDPDVSLISFKKDDPKSWEDWEKSIEKFLKQYQQNDDIYVDCDYGQTIENGKLCRVHLPMAKCTKATGYGFQDGKPCIFLKMNKIFGWKPEPYSRGEIEENKMEMPKDLQEKLLKMDERKLNATWVTCSGESKDDDEILKNTTITYVDDQVMGFPSYYYPYVNQKGYQAPFVAIQIENLPKGVGIRLLCRLWGRNVYNDRQRRLGMTFFEILSE